MKKSKVDLFRLILFALILQAGAGIRGEEIYKGPIQLTPSCPYSLKDWCEEQGATYISGACYPKGAEGSIQNILLATIPSGSPIPNVGESGGREVTHLSIKGVRWWQETARESIAWFAMERLKAHSLAPITEYIDKKIDLDNSSECRIRFEYSHSCGNSTSTCSPAIESMVFPSNTKQEDRLRIQTLLCGILYWSEKSPELVRALDLNRENIKIRTLSNGLSYMEINPPRTMNYEETLQRFRNARLCPEEPGFYAPDPRGEDWRVHGKCSIGNFEGCVRDVQVLHGRKGKSWFIQQVIIREGRSVDGGGQDLWSSARSLRISADFVIDGLVSGTVTINLHGAIDREAIDSLGHTLLYDLEEEQRALDLVPLLARGLHNLLYPGDWNPDGMPAEHGQRTRVTIRVTADGYESTEVSMDIENTDPLTLAVAGTVTDSTGAPISGAHISLTNLDLSTVTDFKGSYRVAASSGASSRTQTWNPVLKQKSKTGTLTITCSETGYIPVPGNAVITIKATDSQGQPQTGVSGTLSIRDHHRASFISLENPSFQLDSSGTCSTTLTTRKPGETDVTFLDTIPLSIIVEAALDGEEGSLKTAESDPLPLGLVRIHGVTTGPDMEPRYNPSPPVLMPRFAHLLSSTQVHSQRQEYPEGEFFILARIPTTEELARVKDIYHIFWNDGARSKLDIPLKGNLQAGEVLEIGKVDLLSPLEHEARVKGYVREFIEAMPLTSGARGHLLGDLSTLSFREGSTGMVPNYTMLEFDPPGQIHIPGSAGEYWDGNPYRVASPIHDIDPAYAIVFHEMGHFIHQRLVETAKLKLFYNLLKGMGSRHTTWSAPDTSSGLSQRVTSFNEATADFFAFLMFHFLKDRHPEFSQSVYFNRGYLAEFDTEEKARNLAFSGGCRIEGIQTTFLKTLYGSTLTGSPPLVFGDYLRVMLMKKDDAWFTKWIPARTMREWVVLKEKYGGIPTTDLRQTATRLNILPCTDQPEITIMPRTSAGGMFTVNGHTLTAKDSTTLHGILIGEEILITRNPFAVMMADTTRGEMIQLSVPQGTRFRFNSATEVQVLDGIMGVRGAITVTTPNGTYTPEGTVWTVEVKEGGTVKVHVLEGDVRARTPRGETVLPAGKAATVTSSGVIETSFDPTTSPRRSLFETPEPDILFVDNPSPPSPDRVQTSLVSEPVPSSQVSPAPPSVSVSDTAPVPKQFLALKRKESGQCVVVVGVEGILPGDRVYGTYSTYEEARKALDKHCNISGTPEEARIEITPQSIETSPSEEEIDTWEAEPQAQDGSQSSATFTIPGKAMVTKEMCRKDGIPPVRTVFLKSGQTVTLSATGTVKAGGSFPAVNCSGLASTIMNKPCLPIQGLPLMRLLGNFEGNIFDAGRSGTTFTAPGDGWLSFGFNDDIFSDNLGEITLTLSGEISEQGKDFDLPADSVSDDKQELVSPLLAVPKYDNDDSTKGIFFINLDTGNAFFIDRVKLSPLSVRTRKLNQNVFRALGRTPGTPAGPGQILVGEIREGGGNVTALLLVDTTTGSMAYITDLETQSFYGKIRKILDRPASVLASSDGNYALLMRRGSSGKTKGAYIYHATTGRGLYFARMEEMKSTPPSRPTTELPTMEGSVSALELQAGNEATEAFLLADNASGTLYYVGDVERDSDILSVRKYRISLFDFFPRDTAVASPRRFVLIPVFGSGGATDHVFVVDVGSGKMALINDVRKPNRTRVQITPRNIYDWFPAQVGGPRVMTAVPKVKGNGETEGAWLFDSATGQILYLEEIRNLSRLVPYRVNQKAR
ncbi:MAG TPA: hypothetical protein PK014_08260 [Thermoanaerobaculia bacterium]|nr:hypothetical protein [Thermoanaerobaculia bacterium]HUM30178.1 hypothetical protein [Thermoanaerobaculia bacterium]HXK68373.1 hypothetical protein [Thermoanaerobaculia bacterium]